MQQQTLSPKVERLLGSKAEWNRSSQCEDLKAKHHWADLLPGCQAVVALFEII
jgi:hypothetical protein